MKRVALPGWIPPFCRQALRRFYVLSLRALVPAAKQDDDGASPLFEVNAVAWTEVDAKLADALPYRPHVSRMPESQTIKPRRDQTTCALVLEP